MISVKALLYSSKMKSDGTSPIVIRIINNRKPQYIYLGHYISKQQWDFKLMKVKKSHPNSVRLNIKIQEKLLEVNKMILDAESGRKVLSKTHLKAKLRNENPNSFFRLANEYMAELEKLKKFNQLAGEKPRIKYFQKFLNGQDIAFEQITNHILRRFSIYLKSERNVSDWTLMNYFVVIRTIFNRAISQGLVDANHYPFGPGKLQIKFPESIKTGLSELEVFQIENLDVPVGSEIWNARNIWLCSFYLAGVRISDIVKLRWSDFIDGRIVYRMKKNSKIVSLKVPEKVSNILELYSVRRNSSPFVFPYLIDDLPDGSKALQSQIRSVNFAINKKLKLIAKECKISKNLTMHLARHTFGQLAGDKVSPQILQKLYRHSHLSTTINYQGNFIHKDLDNALEKILKFQSSFI